VAPTSLGFQGEEEKKALGGCYVCVAPERQGNRGRGRSRCSIPYMGLTCHNK